MGTCNSGDAYTTCERHRIPPCCIAGCNRFQWVLASASLTRADVRMSAGAVGYGDHAVAGRRAGSAFPAPMIVLVDGDAARDYDARRPALPRPLLTRGRAVDAGAGARRDPCPSTDRDQARSVGRRSGQEVDATRHPRSVPSTYRSIPASEAPAKTGARLRVGVPQVLCRCAVVPTPQQQFESRNGNPSEGMP